MDKFMDKFSVKIPVDIFWDERVGFDDVDVPDANVTYALDIVYRNYGIKSIDIILDTILVSYFKDENEFFFEVSPSIQIEKKYSNCYCTPNNLVIYLNIDDTVDYEKSYLELI